MTDTSTNITIENNNAYFMAMGEGTQVIINAADANKESWSQLESTAEAGSNQLVLQEATGWEVGDVIAIASTDSYDQSEEFTILAISEDGTTITLDGDLEYDHRGETTTYDNGLTGDDYMEWEAEIRAEVALLSRNVTIQGDEDSVDDGYGGHTMVMDGAEQYISGAEYYRMGQEGIVGRYALHYHLLDDAEGQYIKNVSVHDTYNKGITVHGTSNTVISENVIFNTSGHSLFFEDGSESGHQIIDNLIFGTMASDEETAAIITDATDVSSYWMESASNTLIGNHAGGSEMHGYSFFPDNEVHGDSAEAGIGEAGDMADLIFQDNVAHSNVEFGLSFEGTIDPDTLEVIRGGTADAKYATVDNFTAYSNALQAIWAFTNDLVIEDSMIVENGRTGLFSKGANYVNDTVFAGNGTAAAQLYTNGGTELSNVHFEDNPGSDLFVHGTSNLSNGPHTLYNITTGDDEVIDINFYNDDAAQSLRTIIDTDGSVTGTAGAVLTGGSTNNEIAAAPDAYYDEDLEVYVSEATTGWTRVISSNDGTLNVTRSDGVVYEDVPYYGNDYVTHTASGMAYDVAYLLDFESVPSQIRLTNQYMQGGESVVYEIPNIDSHGTIRNASAVSSFDEMLTATASSYYFADDSLYVRIVAEESEPGDLPVDEYLADYLDTQSILIQDIVESATPVEDPSFTAALLTAIEDQPARDVNLAPEIAEATLTSANDDFELELYESTADPTNVTDEMARFSDEATFDGGILPGADDILVVEEGDILILDESVTVKGIIVNGGELIIEDDANKTIDLVTDYLLVMNGGKFQAGTETDALDTTFTMTLEGDDPDFDLEVTEILDGNVENTIFTADQSETVTTEVETNSLTATVSDDAPNLIYAVNAGGDEVTAANGIVYQADDFDNGSSFSVTADIAGTEDDDIYQDERWNAGGFTYENELENGIYDVELNFAEIWGGAKVSGDRVFDIYVEDTLIFDNLDVADETGFRTAFDLVGEVEVTDGSLTITTMSEVENPKISGFAIWESEGALSQEFVVGSLYDDYAFGV